MALLVWLPLLGNLENHGILDVNFQYVNNNGKLITNSSGKIGTCYERTASGYADAVRSTTKLPALTGELTMCCWAYVSSTIGATANGLITNHSHVDNSGFGITVKEISTTDYRICCSTGNGTNRTFDTYYGTTNIKNEWHHLALTYDGTSFSLWVDGVVENTVTYANKAISDYFDLFNWSTTHYNNSNFRPTCKLNDVRLYDNCLSSKEIKEIAKGMIAHYPMNQSLYYTNLVKNSTYTIYNNYKVPSTLVKLDEKFQGCDVYRLTQTPDATSISDFRSALGSHGVYGFRRTFKANTKYCFWILYRPVTHPNVRVGGTASNMNGWSEIAPHYYKDGWYRVGQYLNGTITTDKSDDIFTSYCDGTAQAGVPISIDFCCPHLVEGYDYIIEEDDYQDTICTTVFDTSGYSYNGEVTTAIVPTTVNNSARYNNCYHFLPTQCIQFNVPTNIITTGSISFWAKNKVVGSSGTLPFTGQGGSYYLMASSKGTGIFYNNNVSGTLKYYMDGNQVSAPVNDGNWHHYCISGIDITSWTTFYVNHYGDVNSSWNSDIYYSDLRIYNTILSAEDIKELYNAPISITKSGALMTQGEVIES